MGLMNSPPNEKAGSNENEVRGATGYMAEGARPKQREVERCEVEDSIFGVDTKNAGRSGLWRNGDDNPGESTKSSNSKNEYEVKLLSKVVAYRELLQQFSYPQVRADYINNKFGDEISSFTLEALDELRGSLFPQWHGGSLEVISENFSSAAVRLIKLMSNCLETAPHGCEDGFPPSYAKWNETLKMLAQSPYWTDAASKKRCPHIIGEPRITPIKDCKPPLMKTPVATTENHSRRTQRQPLLKKMIRGVEEGKVEEIILSSESSVDSDSSSSSSTDSSSSVERVAIPRLHRKRADKRETVTPPIFEMDGKLPLKSFLSTYEAYFKSKFIGDSRDKCQQLEQFLTGDLLNIYKICGGRRLRYTQMKERLLTHYKKQKIGGREFWRRKFEETTPNPEETLDLYGMRLMEIAELAFPRSPKEAAKMLRLRFLAQIPHRIKEKISDMEKVMKATSGGSQKHFNFSAIMQLAADLQTELPRSHTIRWSDEWQRKGPGVCDQNNNPDVEPSRGREFWSQRHFRHRTPDRNGHTVENQSRSPRMSRKGQEKSLDNWQPGRSNYTNPSHFSNVRQQSSARKWTPEGPKRPDTPVHRKKFCSFCGKKNHQESSCWRAQNACLICGGEHMMKECSKYNPRFSRSDAEASNQEVSIPRGGD